MDGQTFTFSWEVNNLSLCTVKRGYTLVSNNFITSILNDTLWIGFLYARHHDDPEILSFILERCFIGGPETIELSATFQLVASDGMPRKEITTTANIPKGGSFAFMKFESWSEVEKFYLHKDTLKIKCILRNTNMEFITRKLAARTYGDFQTICNKWPLTNFSKVRYGELLEVSVRLREVEFLLDVRLSIQGRPGQKVVIIEFIRRCGPLRDLPLRPLRLNTRITVLDAKGTETEIWKQQQHVFHMRTPVDVWQFPTFISRDSLVRQKNKYLANDVLTLKTEITINPEIIFSKIEERWYATYIMDTPIVDKMIEDMKVLYIQKPLPDVKLRVNGETMPAHRIILHSRSKRFAEMLDGVEDTDNDVLDVPDMDMVMLKRMLTYMYTDKMDDLEYDDAVVAYNSAHKYQIGSLKCKYSCVLQSHLNFRNVCSILMLADECCDQDLKNCALDLMKECWDLVVETEEWENLCKERLLLAQKTRDLAFQTFVIKHCTRYT